MLSDDQLDNLPSDPREAFIEYERICSEQMELRKDASGYTAEREYAHAMLVFDDAHEINLLSEFKFKPPPGDVTSFSVWWPGFRAYVNAALLRIRVERARDHAKGLTTIVRLDPAARSTIHFHITKIREKLTVLDLPENKRDVLFRTLNRFAEEVDRNRTRTDALMAFALEISGAAGKVAENLKPLRDLLDPLFGLVGKAKEQQALPAPEKPRQIEGPKTRADNDENGGRETA